MLSTLSLSCTALRSVYCPWRGQYTTHGISSDAAIEALDPRRRDCGEAESDC